MNSYPLELIAQLAPVMFVAGLNPASMNNANNVPNATSPPLQSIQPPPPTHHSRNPSLTTMTTVSGADSVNYSLSLPPSTTAPNPLRPDPFNILTSRLREILVHQRKITVWDTPTADKVFQVMLIDKDERFPPRKVESSPGAPAHSPLSPLTPSSPLHPDGLIAPIWIRKHTMLVPAVFVLFIRLFEADDPSSIYAYSLGGEHNTEFEQRLKELRDLADRRNDKDTDRVVDRVKDLERLKDTELAALIAQRKRTTNERGIKLTVVLMASRKLLDDSASGAAGGLGLDARLTFIRRQSGLDSRAALFVLSPISREELNDFVKSLQTALWDPAVEYYTAHSKRVRQKRNRHQAQSAQSSHRPTPSVVASSSSTSALGAMSALPAPLKPEGWTVRYEYKMASFAEFRGEYEVALKHYQDAYAALTMLFMAPGSSLAMASGGAGVTMPISTSTSTSTMPTSTSSMSTTSSTSAASRAGVSSPVPNNGGSRTKRWAEAKVLADTINIKIVKLYLYNNETGLALAQQRLHVRTFPVVAGFTGGSAMSTKTGSAPVGGQITPSLNAADEGSYEYWSWVSRMWCILAEMLVEGTRTRGSPGSPPIPPSLIIPIHRPRLPPSSAAVPTTDSGSRKPSPTPESLLHSAAPGVNPAHALMHPGWYYLLAAECAERKVGRFVEGLNFGASDEMKEQKITHLRALVGDILELYTKSYELFKAYSSASTTTTTNTTSRTHTLNASISNPLSMTTSISNASNAVGPSNPPTNTSISTTGRLALYIAHRIALTYARFPDPNRPDLRSTNSSNDTLRMSKDSKNTGDPAADNAEDLDEPGTSDNAPHELDSLSAEFDSWAREFSADADEDESESLDEGNFRGKDPEKLALAARFLARIAKSYWREGVISSSSSSSSSFSASTFSSAYPTLPSMFPGYPSNAGFLTYPIAKYNTEDDGENDEIWGWPALLVPLLRTWSGILRELVGRGINETRKLFKTFRTSQKLDSLYKPNSTLEKLESLEAHFDSYTRVLISRISVDRDVEFSRKKEEMEIQRELKRVMEMWVGVQTLKRVLNKASSDTSSTREVKVIRVDNAETQPIFDTSVVFWSGRIWMSPFSPSVSSLSSSSSSNAESIQESTPFQLTLTAPLRVAIDKLDWVELRVRVTFEYEGYDDFDEGYEKQEEEGEERDKEEGGKEDGEEDDEEGDNREGTIRTDVEEANIDLRTQEIEVIIRSNSLSQGGEAIETLNEPVQMIDVGHLSFGTDFGFDEKADYDGKSSTNKIQEIISVSSSSLCWIPGQAVIVTGSVCVCSSGGGDQFGQGRIRISSVLLRLNAPTPFPPSPSIPNTPPVVLEIPLHVPARRGAPPPPTSYVHAPGSGELGAGAGVGGIHMQAMWFAGFAEIQHRHPQYGIKAPRWVPVSRRGIEKGLGYEGVEISLRPHPVTLSVLHSGVAYVGEEYPLEILVKGCQCDFGSSRPADAEEGKQEEGTMDEEVEVVMDVLLQPVESDVTAVNTISVGPHQSNTMIKGISLGLLALHPQHPSSPSDLRHTLWIKNTGGAGDRVVDMSVWTRPIHKHETGKPNKNTSGINVRARSMRQLPHLETETLKTVIIPCIEPLNVRYDVTYQRRVDPSSYSTLNPGEGALWDRPQIPWWLDEEKDDHGDEGEGGNRDRGDTWDERVEADVEAVLRTTILCVGGGIADSGGSTSGSRLTSVASLGVEVEKVVLRRKDPRSTIVRILSSEMILGSEKAVVKDEGEEQEEDGELSLFPLEFLPGDQLSDVCRIGISSHRNDEEIYIDADGELEIPSLGSYEVHWRRILPNNTRGTPSSTKFPLPALRPPTDDLIALLDVSPTARLHEPLAMTLTIRNRHPTRTADVYVQLEFPPGTGVAANTSAPTGTSVGGAVPMGESTVMSNTTSTAGEQGGQSAQSGSAFVIAGLRAGRVPLLLAGTEERMVWMLIPIECGYVRLPKVQVLDRRKAALGTAGMLGAGSIGSSSNARSESIVAVAGNVIDNVDKNGSNAEGGREVRVVDIRSEYRAERTKRQVGTDLVRTEEGDDQGRIETVLVLP
ncbi:hypothetical protein EV359DRAFT_64503 [Lentinula novae-zelandiae]|nr:hypothetical protein EV359DRAFT_64503 [Lentinula novae-zelandiae]